MAIIGAVATMVISGSAKDQAAIRQWVDHWSDRGFTVIDHPSAIPEDRFREAYPEVFRSFYARLATCDVLFVMNEDRQGVAGYVGPATFAELAFAVARNAREHGSVEIIMALPVGPEVHGAEEIGLWHDLGWISFLEDRR